jgi:hypothetical protein
MKIGILGYGEIGSSIDKLFHPRDKVLVEDKNLNSRIGEQVEILHVCIPYSKDFIDIVAECTDRIKPELTIIHSTVKVGTTKELFDNGINVVHSPVRGMHPNLTESLRVFTKFIGSDDLELGLKALNHFKELDITVAMLKSSSATELGKLLDTTYYGVCISFHSYANELCEEVGVPVEDVMGLFNTTYNQGYTKMNVTNVVRPVLYPPKGKIGGHCVVPNAKLLQEQFGEDPILQRITGDDIEDKNG